MARERGTFNFSASLEPKKQGALDARLVVNTYSELTSPSTWADVDNKIWLYDGMVVSVVADDDTSLNGVYMLKDKDNYNLTESWKRIDAQQQQTITIVDDLTSTDGTVALSANQGRILNEKITNLDSSVSAVKDKTVETILTGEGSDDELPTTKAVIDYVKESTDGLANNLTCTPKEGDPTKMEWKLIAVDGTVLSTIETDKDNIISNIVKRPATEEDHTADESINVGDPILVVTTVDGTVFRVNLKELVDVYTGVNTDSVNTTVDGYTIKSDVKIDTAANATNGTVMSIGSNGLSVGLLWTEL